MTIPLDYGNVMWSTYSTSLHHPTQLTATFRIPTTAAGTIVGTQGNHGRCQYLVTGILDGGNQYVALQCGTFDGYLATVVVDEGSCNARHGQQGFADAASTPTTRHATNGQFNTIHVTFSVR
jgi:hypothetical protein